MFKGKYSTVLTVLLIALIVAIVIIVVVLGINTYKNYVEDRDAKHAQIEPVQPEKPIFDDDDDNNIDEEPVDKIEGPTGGSTGTDDGSKVNLPKVQYYKSYPMIGKIEIPKTKASYPILVDSSPGALEVAVSVTYPSSPKLNQAGNTVIIGHNYRNGKLFSENDTLETGDIIKVTDLDGKTLTYTIYEIFQTVPTDTAYMTRDRGDDIEISLSTCTDDGNNRLVILAKVEQ